MFVNFKTIFNYILNFAVFEVWVKINKKNLEGNPAMQCMQFCDTNAGKRPKLKKNKSPTLEIKK